MQRKESNPRGLVNHLLGRDSGLLDWLCTHDKNTKTTFFFSLFCYGWVRGVHPLKIGEIENAFPLREPNTASKRLESTKLNWQIKLQECYKMDPNIVRRNHAGKIITASPCVSRYVK